MTAVNANLEILHHLSEARQMDASHRFVVMGSLARGALLGAEMGRLSDPHGRRFSDVDVIDKQNILRQLYSFKGGTLDSRPTQSVRPLDLGDTTWGFFDRFDKNPESDPLSVFPEAALGLHPINFSEDDADHTVTIPNTAAILILSKLYAYANYLPKHQDQLQLLRKQANDTDSTLQEAYDEYIETMKLRYLTTGYAKARQLIFNRAPAIAQLAKEGKVGDAVRRIRGTTVETLPLEEL